MEDDKILVKDFDTIAELSSFVGKGQSYEGSDGNSDDLVMCLVLFAWLSDQTYFKELTNLDIRRQLWSEKQNLVDQDMAPFGFVLDGVTDEHGEKIGETIDEYGSVWNPVVTSNREYLEDW